MRLLATLLLALAAACASMGRGSGSLAGRYLLREVNARPLPAASPTEAGVTLDAGALVLEAGARYTLELTARTASDPAPRAVTAAGTYAVRGDTLALSPVGGGDVRFHLVRDGAALRLRDEAGNEMTFARP